MIGRTRLVMMTVVAAAAMAVGSTAARGQTVGQAQSAGERPFSLYWLTGSIQDDAWANRIDFRGLPMRLDIRCLDQGVLGYYPFPGPHLIDQDPNYMARHLPKVREWTQRLIPDPNYDGLVWIDYEIWWPVWEWTPDEPSSPDPLAYDYDIKSDWREHMRQNHANLLAGLSAEQQEQVIIDRYEQVCKMFWTQTIREVKMMRPRAKVGFYSAPPVGFFWALNEPERVREINDTKLAWLWEECDVLFPSIYQGWEAVERPDGTAYERDRFIANTNKVPAIDNERWMRFLVEECKRVARGKPVYAVIWSKYNGRDPVNNPQFVAETNLKQMVEIPKDVGADGIVVWDYFYNWQQFLDFREFWNTKYGPRLLSVLAPAERANVNFRFDMIHRTSEGRTLILRDAGAPAPTPEPPPAGPDGMVPTRLDPQKLNHSAHPGKVDTRVPQRSTPGATAPVGAAPLPTSATGGGVDRPPVVVPASSPRPAGDTPPKAGPVVVVPGQTSKDSLLIGPLAGADGQVTIVKP
ncbi:MAG: hypothetical protein KF745_09200 [Phycisphaeraceae bacterium]|nr:hypothetical protein [Phycisphaeraceae bacterium]